MKIIYKTKDINNDYNTFLFGLKNFSTLEKEITLDEIKNINKEIFLAINKNIFNKDLIALEDILKEIDNYNISGIFFYDLSVLGIAKKLGIKTPLIWAQDYLAVNYKTINFYEKHGIKGALIPQIITKDEILEIANNTDIDILTYGFGYQMIALSKRKLISNYFEYINEENNNEVSYMIERNISYPTKEEEYGTKIYSSEILNSIRYINEFKKNDIKYLILDDFLIDKDIFKKVSSIYEKAVNEDLKDEELISLEKEINSIIPNTSTLFLDKKTVFEVKK